MSGETLTTKQVCSTTQLSILFVDDEIDLRELISEGLTAAGYNVVQASNGRDALDILTKTPSPWFALITDFNMPHVNGGMLVKTAIGLGIKFQTIIMASSSVDYEPLAQELMHEGHIHAIPKPYKVTDLMKILILAKLKDIERQV